MVLEPIKPKQTFDPIKIQKMSTLILKLICSNESSSYMDMLRDKITH